MNDPLSDSLDDFGGHAGMAGNESGSFLVDGPEDDGSGEGGKKSTAALLVELAVKDYDIRPTTTGDVVAIPESGPKVVRALRGGRTPLTAELAAAYWKSHRRAPSKSALTDALAVIEGMAQDRDPVEMHTRVAATAGAWWLDLGDQTGAAVRITSDGWEVVDQPPVLFARSELTGAHTIPERGGDLLGLWELVNVPVDDRALLLAWLVCALCENVAHPAVALLAEQGSGKTSAAKILSSLIDPSPVPARKPPRDPESWVTAASGSWVVSLDNLSTIPPWLSDSLCRAVTGDADVRRRLYTDGQLSVFRFRRALILNGIDLGSIRGDLADRLLLIDIERIDSTRRMTDEELAERWEQLHARMLGALLDLAAQVLAVLPDIRLDELPRMADFAKVLAAVDYVAGTRGLDRYLKMGETLSADVTAGDQVLAVITRSITEEFKNTAAELLAILPSPEPRPRDWPTTAGALTGILKRGAPALRRLGWTVECRRGGHANALHWQLRPPASDGEPTRNGAETLPPCRIAAPAEGDPMRQGGKCGNESGPSLIDLTGDTRACSVRDCDRTATRDLGLGGRSWSVCPDHDDCHQLAIEGDQLMEVDR